LLSLSFRRSRSSIESRRIWACWSAGCESAFGRKDENFGTACDILSLLSAWLSDADQQLAELT